MYLRKAYFSTSTRVHFTRGVRDGNNCSDIVTEDDDDCVLYIKFHI